MFGKLLILIAVMFVAFIILYGVTGIFAAMMAEENRHVCRNCEYYDKAMSCCYQKWHKVEPTESCKAFRKAKEERR
jgi:hypothetical protein